jgi:hypothetical protein
MGIMHIKLSRTTKTLHLWLKTLIPQTRIALAVCREVTKQLEKAQENRMITPQERSLMKHLKHRILGLSAIYRSRARQKSRLTWLQQGEANTKYFHKMASTRKKNNFIQSLQTDHGLATSQLDKHQEIFSHFLHYIGTYAPRSCAINLTNLGWHPRPLLHLEADISKNNVKKFVLSGPEEKAPDPDGFIGLFFSLCWEITREDLMLAINQFFSINQQNLHLLNQAYIVLIPKKKCPPKKISDFRAISLIHSFAKIVSKILANRLGPELGSLISTNQAAFIQKRCIHDSFVYVKEVIKGLHKKNHSIFIKLDISKAFDTINWPYLIGIMSHFGFGQKWRDWITVLWCTSSSTVLLNGEQER